jgi:hypothetical protein
MSDHLTGNGRRTTTDTDTRQHTEDRHPGYNTVMREALPRHQDDEKSA